MPEFETMLKELRTQFNSGKTKDLKWRRQQLEQVAVMIEENTELFTSTVRKDLGGGKIRGIGEMLSHTAAEHALANLDSWTADEAVPTPLELSPTRLSSSYIRHDPKGVVLIIAPWNYPIQLMFTPLVAAIAAGNCVVIKPSEVSGNCAGLIGDMVNKYLDTTCIKVVQGGVEETTALLKLEWDHIFFTGSTTVGKVVMKAAAEYLTPISLELGGKSPVIIDKSAKMKSVIHRISYAKWYNVGQTCIAPDYVLVHKSRYQEFVDEMKKDIARSFGENAQGASDWGRIINERHLGRIAGLVEQTKGEVLLGGPAKSDSGDRFFPPTLVKCTSLDEPLLREEIFGPVLPIITIDDTQDSIEIVRKVCEKPLALYVFAEDKKVQKQILDATHSGGACINSAMDHVANIHLPFGGIGPSGMGKGNGKFGFEEFTHKRAVFKAETLIKTDATLPPFPVPETLYNVFVAFLVTGVVPRQHRKLVRTSFYVLAAAAAAAAAVRTGVVDAAQSLLTQVFDRFFA